MGGKLCYGISDQLEEFIAMLRKDCTKQMDRLDSDFFQLLAFSIQLQKSLSLYFQARSYWDNTEYGIAIGLLSEATVALRTRFINITRYTRFKTNTCITTTRKRIS